jgi:hypothetical protein
MHHLFLIFRGSIAGTAKKNLLSIKMAMAALKGVEEFLDCCVYLELVATFLSSSLI